jgi:hypothetical protein
MYEPFFECKLRDFFIEKSNLIIIWFPLKYRTLSLNIKSSIKRKNDMLVFTVFMISFFLMQESRSLSFDKIRHFLAKSQNSS